MNSNTEISVISPTTVEEENGQTFSDDFVVVEKSEPTLMKTPGRGASRTRRAQPVEGTEPRPPSTRRRTATSTTPQEVSASSETNQRPESTEKPNDDVTVISSDVDLDAYIKSSLDNLMTSYNQAAKQKDVSTEEIIKAGERELRARNRLLARRRGRGRL